MLLRHTVNFELEFIKSITQQLMMNFIPHNIAIYQAKLTN